MTNKSKWDPPSCFSCPPCWGHLAIAVLLKAVAVLFVRLANIFTYFSHPRVDISKVCLLDHRGKYEKLMNTYRSFCIFRPMEQITQNVIKQGQDLFPTNLDVADILGRTYVHFVNFVLFGIACGPHFQMSRIPDFCISDVQIFQTPGGRRWRGMDGRTDGESTLNSYS